MKKQNVFWGLMMILTAILIILYQFELFPGIGVFDIVVTVIMIAVIIISARRINFWGIFFPLAVICIIFDNELNITGFTPWTILLSAFFLSLGLSLIFKRDGHLFINIGSNGDFNSSYINEQDGNTVTCSTVFGDTIKYINTDDFQRANIKTVFGDVKMYFDNAKIPSEKADIYLDVVFGDVDLYVPMTWNIVNKTHAVFGDFSILRNNVVSDSPVVNIYGNVIFGDVKVIYV